jgi:hypothetical protein
VAAEPINLGTEHTVIISTKSGQNCFIADFSSTSANTVIQSKVESKVGKNH